MNQIQIQALLKRMFFETQLRLSIYTLLPIPIKIVRIISHQLCYLLFPNLNVRQVNMKIHSVAFLLSSVVTVVQSQNVKYCNYGTSDSALECSNVSLYPKHH